MVDIVDYRIAVRAAVGGVQRSNRTERGAGGPTPLSKERVLRQALALADKEGIDALSMRRLGRELDAGAMSLYHHVGNKEELLDGMVDLVFAEIHLPESRGDWQAAMRAWAVSARQVLARHPWAIILMQSRTTPGPANLQHREADGVPAQGRLLHPDGHPRELAPRQLHLRLRPPGGEPPLRRCRRARGHDPRGVPAATAPGGVPLPERDRHGTHAK